MYVLQWMLIQYVSHETSYHALFPELVTNITSFIVTISWHICFLKCALLNLIRVLNLLAKTIPFEYKRGGLPVQGVKSDCIFSNYFKAPKMCIFIISTFQKLKAMYCNVKILIIFKGGRSISFVSRFLTSNLRHTPILHSNYPKIVPNLQNHSLTPFI